MAIFWHSNGNFQEGQIYTFSSPGFGVEGSRGWGGRPGQNVNAADVVSEAIMDQVVTSPARTHYAEYDDYTALEAAARDYDDRNCS